VENRFPRQVFSFQGKILDKDFIGSDAPVKSCDYYCYLDSSSGLMYSLYPDEQQDLSLDVVDVKSGKLRATTSGDIVDFHASKEKATVYMNGRIVELALSENK
jgi:hypothetical protein